MVQACTIMAWVLLIISVSFLESARPERETFLDRRYNKVMRVSWDPGRANMGMGLLTAGLVVSVLGLGIEVSRKLRFKVALSRFLIAVTVLTLFAYVVYQQAL